MSQGRETGSEIIESNLESCGTKRLNLPCHSLIPLTEVNRFGNLQDRVVKRNSFSSKGDGRDRRDRREWL
jgi:hypothetical protein